MGRRTKCDGQPRCATCVAHDEQCIYDPDQDGRKPATKLYVEALVNRVRALEQELEETRANLGLTSPSGHAHAQGHVRREAVSDSPVDETSPLSVLSGRSARSAQASTVVGTTGALRVGYNPATEEAELRSDRRGRVDASWTDQCVYAHSRPKTGARGRVGHCTGSPACRDAASRGRAC